MQDQVNNDTFDLLILWLIVIHFFKSPCSLKKF